MSSPPALSREEQIRLLPFLSGKASAVPDAATAAERKRRRKLAQREKRKNRAAAVARAMADGSGKLASASEHGSSKRTPSASSSSLPSSSSPSSSNVPSSSSSGGTSHSGSAMAEGGGPRKKQKISKSSPATSKSSSLGVQVASDAKRKQAVVDGETVDKPWVQYKLELCKTWIQCIVEKISEGKHDEAKPYLDLVHKELIRLGRLANTELLASSKADLGGIDTLYNQIKQKS